MTESSHLPLPFLDWIPYIMEPPETPLLTQKTKKVKSPNLSAIMKIISSMWVPFKNTKGSPEISNYI